MSLQDELQTLQDRRGEVEDRLDALDAAISEAKLGEDTEDSISGLAELIAEKRAAQLLAESLSRDILDCSAAIAAERRLANKTVIDQLDEEYAERVRQVAATVRRLQTQLTGAEEIHQRIRQHGGSRRFLIPVFLITTVDRTLGWWSRKHVEAAGASPRRRSYQEQSERDALENAERGLARVMGLFRNAKRKGDIVSAEHFQEQVEKWQERVRYHGGDPSRIAPSEEVLAPIRPGVVQRVSELPEKISRFGFGEWFKRQSQSS